MSVTFYQCEGCLQPITALTRDGKLPAHGWYERRTRHPCALVGTRNYTTYEGDGDERPGIDPRDARAGQEADPAA